VQLIKQNKIVNIMIKQLLILATVILGAINLSSAQITFQKSYGGQSLDEGSYALQTTDGGYIVVGTKRSSTTIASQDIYLVKTDANGDTVWTKSYGNFFTPDYGTWVQQTSDGGYIIVGTTSSFGAGQNDIYLIKTDANGNLLWSKTIGTANGDGAGTVQQTADGGYIISGGITVSTSSAMYLIKTDANGDSLWSKTYSISSLDVLSMVKQTTDGGYILVGHKTTFSVSSSDIYLLKTDANGNIIWSKTIGGTNNDFGVSIHQTTDGGFIITGSSRSFGGTNFYDVYLIKTDVTGNLVWSKCFGNADNQDGISVQQTTDGGYIVAGNTRTQFANSYDIYLIKTDSNGDSLWTRTISGLNDDLVRSVRQTSDGGYIIAGTTKSFGAGSSDVFLIKTDANGNSGCNQSNISTVVSTPATIVSPATFNVGYTSATLTSPATNISSGSIVNTACTSVGIIQLTAENVLEAFPNPASDKIIVSFGKTIINGNIRLLNIIGEIVFTQKISNESKREFNLRKISEGIYFVKVFDGDKYYCKKIIIQQD
jgi:outer membrane protein assembly factor BamB